MTKKMITHTFMAYITKTVTYACIKNWQFFIFSEKDECSLNFFFPNAAQEIKKNYANKKSLTKSHTSQMQMNLCNTQDNNFAEDFCLNFCNRIIIIYI